MLHSDPQWGYQEVDMSIREDAKNERTVEQLLGYNPEIRIANLRRRIRELEDELREVKLRSGYNRGMN